MSGLPSPGLPAPVRSDYQTPASYQFAQAVFQLLSLRSGLAGPADEQMVLRRELQAMGLVSSSGGGTNLLAGGTSQSIGLGSLSSELSPDYSPPTPISNLQATSLFSGVFLTWDAPTYAQGGGNAYTEVWEAVYSGTGPLPTFGNAVMIGSSAGQTVSFIATGRLGTQRHYWVRAVTTWNVAQTTPTGGTNGVQMTVGKVGNADLGSLIVQAGNLADGSVTGTKLASLAIDATKFANGIEPVTIVTSVPGLKSTTTIVDTTTGKLYRWNGTSYVATVPTTDLTGTIADAQIAGLAASKVTGTLSDAQLAAISAAKVTGQITSTQITDNAITTAKLAAGAVTASQIAADTITAAQIAAGAVTSSELAAGAVVAGKIAAGTIQASDIAAGSITGDRLVANTITAAQIAANTITAGQIAAGAIGAAQIAAGAITTGKLLVTGQGKALNDDPACMDISAWINPQANAVVVTGAGQPVGSYAIRMTNAAQLISRDFPIEAGKKYKVSIWARQVSGGGSMYLRMYCYDVSRALITYAVIPLAGGTYEGVMVPGTWTKYVGYISPSAGAIVGAVFLHANWNTVGVTDVCDFRAEEYIGADLIVDGAIQANHLAANSIAVGSAAIQNGAITNAMIANLAVDNAKIADATIQSAKIASIDAGKITTGTLDANRIGANSITAAMIDSRGLSIKDASGNVILAAGNALDFSNVGGATKPANNATVGATWGTNITSQPADSALLNSYAPIGQNLIPNSDQATCTWAITYNPNGATFDTPPMRNDGTSTGWTMANYVLNSSTTTGMWCHQNNRATGTADGVGDDAVGADMAMFAYAGGPQVTFPVSAGDRVCFSYYYNAHHCKSWAYIQFRDANGTALQNAASGVMAQRDTTGYSFDTMGRNSVIGTAPAGAVCCTFFVRKLNTMSYSSADSYFWIVAPQLEKCSPNQTGPSPYMPGPPGNTRQLGFTGDLNATAGATIGVNLSGQITAANASTFIANAAIGSAQVGTINANQVNASSLSAITATIGTLRTAASGARTEIRDNVIKVYDASNVLRVRIGDLTL